MAHQKLANGQNTEQETDIAVVAPSNMGKGFGWDVERKQYEINVNQGNGIVLNQDGTVGLQLSIDEGNQIQLRQNGIYFGGKAEEHLANLYVANHGNDNHPGTREAPLRTIQKAVEMTKQDTALYHIHLHSNHEFDWVDHSNINARYIFRVYGVEDDYPDSIETNVYYRGYVAETFPRAIINVKVREKWGFIKRMHLTCFEAEFRGIHIKIFDKVIGKDNKNKSGHFSGIVNAESSRIVLSGSILELCTGATKLENGYAGAYRADALFRTKTLILINSIIPVPLDKFVKDGSANAFSPLVYGFLSPSVFTSSWHNQLMGGGIKPDYPALGGTSEKVRENIKIDTLATEISWDTNTKTIFGMTTNWDIFANS